MGAADEAVLNNVHKKKEINHYSEIVHQRDRLSTPEYGPAFGGHVIIAAHSSRRFFQFL
jgi:hypothetical protein